MVLKDNTGECYWTYELEEFRLNFIARHENKPDEVLMTFRLFEQDKFLAVAVLIGERQHLWGDWRSIAEATDGNTLSGHIADLILGDCLMPFEEVIVREQGSFPSKVTVAAKLPFREVNLLAHRFETVKHKNAFLGWARQNARGHLFGLCLLGFFKGRHAMADKMDAVAAAHLQQGVSFTNLLQAMSDEGLDEVSLPGGFESLHGLTPDEIAKRLRDE